MSVGRAGNSATATAGQGSVSKTPWASPQTPERPPGGGYGGSNPIAPFAGKYFFCRLIVSRLEGWAAGVTWATLFFSVLFVVLAGS